MVVNERLHCKKRLNLTLFPARESLVSDITAGDGKTAILFLQCTVLVDSFYYDYLRAYNS
jgi:hypothetical protein